MHHREPGLSGSEPERWNSRPDEGNFVALVCARTVGPETKVGKMMNTRVRMFFQKALSIACALLVIQFGPLLAAQDYPSQPEQAPPAQTGSTAQALSPDQLANLVAPVALYPDSLLSQVLVAATYPLEVVEAAQWLQQNRDLRGTELVEAARQQNWDASVQALVVFPDVVNRLNSNIRWTTDLGNAFLAQQADVMNAVQSMRAQARAEGKLNSSPQETVTTQTQGGQSVIEIQPANPQVVYVPTYNPEYIWGPPVYGYYPPLYYPEIGFGFGFGSGIFIGGFFGGLGWGGWGWGPSWFGHSIYVNNYFFNHYGYNGYRGGRSFQGRGGWAHDPGHRQGVPYPNSGLSNRYYGNSGGRGGAGGGRNAGQGYAGSRQQPSNGMNSGGNFGNRGSQGTNAGSPRSFSQQGGVQSQQGAGQRGNFSRGAANGGTPQRNTSPQSNSAQGWQRFSGPGSGTNQSAASSGRGGWSTTSSSRPSSPGYSTNGGYRSSPSYSSGGSGSYGAGRAAPSYRPSSPAYSGGGGYRSSPSYSGGSGSYGGGRAAPSYRSSSPAYSGGGGGSRGGGGSFSSHPSGGGGGSRSSGGGGSSHSSGGGNSGGRHR
jgi:hypothetical protein